MRILRQTLTRQWFDLILKGEKLEEYREIKKHWIQRLTWNEFHKDATCINSLKDAIYENSERTGWKKMESVFCHFDAIEFTNGYGNHMPKILIECKGINIGRGKPEWGAPTDRDVFIEQLGKILETKNIK